MTESIQKSSKIEAWFDDFMATLRTHQVQLETSTASSQLKKFYETIFTGNVDDIAYMNKQNVQQHFVKRIIFEYLELTKEIKPSKLAFDYNDSEVLVWAEVTDNDEKTERLLLKAEATINAKFHGFGFDMETTIVEASDTLDIPNHYKAFKA